jgi:glycosyltransferase involved in cell wall biosynthesis
VDSTAEKTLSVVIPVYNERSWITNCLHDLVKALEHASWADVEIIVVDDGSTDGTSGVLDSLESPMPTRIVHRLHSGRFGARLEGLRLATAPLVLLLDSRVTIAKESLRWVRDRMSRNPGERVWNGHVETDATGNLYARLWRAVSYIAWRAYLANPRPVSYGLEDFDRYPKGTTCFLAPREDLIQAAQQVQSLFPDLKHANDDAILIRSLAERHRIHIAPGFRCTYHPRHAPKAIVRHLLHRGTVFVDGYMRRGTRYFVPLVMFFVATPLGLLAIALKPILFPVGIAAASCGLFIFGLALGVPLKDTAALAVGAPLFGVVYAAGLWRGLFLAARARRRIRETLEHR